MHGLAVYVKNYLTCLTNIGKVFSVEPSAKVIVLGEFDLHYKTWLTRSERTDTLCEFCHNFPICYNPASIV